MPSLIAWRLQDKECSISLFYFNMAKSNELPKRTREHIGALHEKGVGYMKISAQLEMKISAQLEIPISTISDTIRRFKFCQLTASLPGSGRPCIISDRTKEERFNRKTHTHQKAFWWRHTAATARAVTSQWHECIIARSLLSNTYSYYSKMVCIFDKVDREIFYYNHLYRRYWWFLLQ